MGKGYYFTLSVEIPTDIPTQKAKEYYMSTSFISTLESEYGCEVEPIGITKDLKRAEYKVYIYEGREKVVNEEINKV